MPICLIRLVTKDELLATKNELLAEIAKLERH
jgi:hypothetical protein